MTPYALSVTASNQSRSYGALNPELTGSLVGVQNQDNLSALYATVADTNSPVGSYPITVTLVDPDQKLGNYSVVTNPGTLTVSAAELRVVAGDAVRSYGHCDKGETAAIVVEPVLGEGGYVVPPASFLRGLREICDEHGILLVVDEVQSGFGRTGRFFALEHFDLRPDIMTMAKGLASGLPLSGVAAPRGLMEKWIPGTHGGTYGGNAVACAAAEATVRVLQEESLVDNAARMGRVLLDGLRGLQARCSLLGDVRGLGLMVGVEFTGADGRPDKAAAKAVRLACQNRGLLLLTCGPYDNVIRWMPPLIVTRAQLAEALAAFEEALQAAGA